ncbi:hypothetical protein ACFL6M_05015 [Candidatus Eisenbacteria bacterium]|uniref:Fibronectin type-III domain-containing protein n=1 Tax=Eiseniibacteriota bacterium TaxID=2212470 RepID=A0ABV6YKS3_UNCEI
MGPPRSSVEVTSFRVDGGGYSSYGTFTSSPISFTASGDGFYEFYTVATDSVGNVETVPALADASTYVDSAAPNAPTLAAEPAYTAGTSNTLGWSDESGGGATGYLAAVATDAGFTAVVDSSGWVGAISHEFTDLTDGQIYYYRVKARNAALNESGWSNVESSIQDDSVPISSVDTLPPSQNTLTFDVLYTASDASSGVASVELLFQVDGGGYSSYGTFTSSPISFTASGDGFYEFYTVATDSVGNVEAAPAAADASTEVDTAAPNAPTLTTEPAYTPGTGNTVSWSDESASGATEYLAAVATDAGFTANVDSSDWIAGTNHTFSDLTDAQIYYYRVKARDAALNESGWSNVESSTQDDTAPLSSVDALPPYRDVLTFNVPYTASDAISGVASVELFFQVDGVGYSSYGSFTSSPISFTASGDGTYDFYTVATDDVGNVETAPATADASTEVDTSTPAAPALNAEPVYTAGTSNTISWGAVTKRDSPVSYFTERSTDSGFTTGVVNSGWIAVTSHEFTGLSDGQIYYYRVKARDAALNESGWSNVESSTQDDTAPLSSVDALQANQDTRTFSVPYTASDATSGVALVELLFQVDGGGYSSYGTFTSSPISFTAGGDGFYEFYTVATDSVGNVETAPATADASTTVDEGAPDAPTLTAEPAHTAGTSNTVSWSDESGSGATEYFAAAATDAGFTADVDSSGWIASTSHSFSGLTDTQIYYYRVKARDAALDESDWSNVESSTQDDTAPISSVDALPADQDTLTFNVPYTASDATSGVASVELFFQIDGGGYGSYGTFTGSPISFTAIGDGLYDFYTVATDSAGNVEATPATADASTTVEVGAPNTPTLAAEPTYTSGTSNTVSWSDESASGATEYFATVATDAGFTSVVDSSDWIGAISHEFTDLTDGQIYYYRVRARDAALNASGWSNVESSTQDDSAPLSSIDALPAYQDTLTFNVPYTASDATSGVTSIELLFQVDGSGYGYYGVFTSSPISFTANGDGVYEFYTVATDSVGNVEATPATADASTIVNVNPPGAVSDIVATPGHKKVTVTWTDPGDSDILTLEIWRGLWHDGSHNSAYPEYDDLSGNSIPVRPTNRDTAQASPEWSLVGYASPGEQTVVDEFADHERGIYYYEIFAQDEGGLYGLPSSANGRATNYWLGDFTGSALPFDGNYDGYVDFNDINALTSAYFTTHGDSAYVNEADVGPTDDQSGQGIPHTDNAIDFEDLIIVAMNNNTVTPLTGIPVLKLPEAGDTGPLALHLEAPAVAELGEEMVVQLRLDGNGDQLKGASLILDYDPEVLQWNRTSPSPALTTGGIFLTDVDTQRGEIALDFAAVGAGQTIRGSGQLLEFVFVPKQAATIEIGLKEVKVRDAKNVCLLTKIDGVLLETADLIPMATCLVGAQPNPFRTSASILFDLNREEHVTLRVYDIQGRLVQTLIDGRTEAGHRFAIWDGNDEFGAPVGLGVYFVTMQAGPYQSIMRAIKCW